MPIAANPDGVLDIENATLRSREIATLSNFVAGNDEIRSSGAPVVEIYGDPANVDGVLPTLELVSNTEAVTGSSFTRFTSNAGVFTLQSGTNGDSNSKGDIAFSSIGGVTEHMRIKGSSGNVGIGTNGPTGKLEIGHYGGAIGDLTALRMTNFATNLHPSSLTEYNLVVSDIDAATGIGNGKLSIAYRGNKTDGLSHRLVINQQGYVGINNFKNGGGGEPRAQLHIGRRVTGAGDYPSFNTIPSANMGTTAEFPKGTHIWAGNSAGNAEEYWGLAIGTTWYGKSYIQNLDKSYTTYYGLLLNPNGGNVGIGTTDPTGKFHIKQAGLTHGDGIRIEHSTTGWYWDIFRNGGNDLTFGHNGTSKAFFDYDGANNVDQNFTGQHRTFIKDIPFTQARELEGLIVSADNNKYIKMSGGIETGSNAITINESLPVVSFSNVALDKKCFGVISTSEDPDTRENRFGNIISVSEKEFGDTRVYINSVGEGAIWVTNINGSLESGDYITTSNVAGYGQRQDSEFLANYTVAKITMDCDFDPVTQPIKIIKKEMGDVNYWVNKTYVNVTEEEYSNLTDENRRIVDDVYQKINKEESKTEQEGWELEVRQELVNVLDEHGQIQWEDDPSGATEKAYKIRYLDANGVETDEANHVYKAAFVGCTYHCG